MPATDKFTNTGGISAPLVRATAVTPDDAADLAAVSRAVHVGGAGDLRVTMAGEEPNPADRIVTFANIGPGWHPIRVVRVWATGTTATGIVAGS